MDLFDPLEKGARTSSDHQTARTDCRQHSVG
jgi:hypothetical protein